ncbi:MAG: hypothetical protein IT186_07885 [Acidobacteria bacterium]|nr:hypothetical protein [Acidobacteriota bacterium]
MSTPWFAIRCPTCGQFWGEEGSHAPGEQIVRRCLLCQREVTILYGLASTGGLAITAVNDVGTGRAGDWSPLLDARVHWREVN